MPKLARVFAQIKKQSKFFKRAQPCSELMVWDLVQGVVTTGHIPILNANCQYPYLS